MSAAALRSWRRTARSRASGYPLSRWRCPSHLHQTGQYPQSQQRESGWTAVHQAISRSQHTAAPSAHGSMAIERAACAVLCR